MTNNECSYIWHRPSLYIKEKQFHPNYDKDSPREIAANEIEEASIALINGETSGNKRDMLIYISTSSL